MERCPKCRALTGEDDHFCRRCGTHLDQEDRSAHMHLFWIALIAVAAVVAFIYWVSPERPVTTDSLFPEREPADVEMATTRPKPAPSAPPPAPGNTALSFPSVWVRISDASGREIAALAAPVVGNGWVALPRREVLGGVQWEAELPDGQRVAISAGVQADGDTLGLWQLEATSGLTPPPLGSWDPQAPLVWRPLASDDLFPVALEASCSRQTHFDRCPGAAAAATSGLLLQDGRVVGWTFDEQPAGRFLWIGATGDSLQPSLRVNDFYRLSFADGREEQLLLAM
jgi:hypothetical protein